MKNSDHFSLHRYNEQVALGGCDIPGTLYLTPETARKLAHLLFLYANDVSTVKFTDSQLRTTTTEHQIVPILKTHAIKDNKGEFIYVSDFRDLGDNELEEWEGILIGSYAALQLVIDEYLDDDESYKIVPINFS